MKIEVWDICNNNILYSLFSTFLYIFSFVDDIFNISEMLTCYPRIRHVFTIPKKMQFILRSSRTTLHFRMIIDNNSFSFVPTYSCRGSYVWRDSRLRANNPQDYSRKGFLHCCCASTWATISSSSPLNEHERRQTLRWT